MFRVFLALGSNQGDRLHYLSKAILEIKRVVDVSAVSSIYETEPVGMAETELFFNMVLEAKTTLLPAELLNKLKKIETALGRKHNSHNSPREIDIDIVLYEDYIFKDEAVELPHPEMWKRKFVLEPFNEIAPGVVHPIWKKTINELYTGCTDSHNVTRTNYLLTA